MRTRILTASAVAVTTAAVAVLGAAGSDAAGTKTVRVEDYDFSPATLTVSANTKVKFVFVGKATHNVTLLKGPKGVKEFNSKNMKTGSFSETFKKKGTYRLDCSIHSMIMRMTIKVR